MGWGQLGKESSLSGPGLELEIPSSKIPDTKTKIRSNPDCTPKRTFVRRCCGRNKIPKVSGKTIPCPQERFSEEEDNPGSVKIKSLHQYSIIQNDISLMGGKISPSKCRHCVYRFKRCILACSYCKVFQIVPRVHAEREEIPVQSNALWSIGGPKNIHQDSISNNCSLKETRNIDNCLFGRSFDMGKLHGELPIFSQRNPSSSSAFRISDKLEKIKVDSIQQIRMVGNNLEYEHPKSFSSKEAHNKIENGRQETAKIQENNQERSPVSCRDSKLRFNCGSHPEGLHQTLVLLPKEISSKDTGQEFKKQAILSDPSIEEFPNSQENNFKLVKKGPHSQKDLLSNAPSMSRPFYRCFKERLGLPYFNRYSKSRHLAKEVSESSHKHSGDDSSLLSLKRIKPSKPTDHQSTFGQCFGSFHPEEGGVNKIKTTQLLDVFDCEVASQKKLVLGSNSYCREVKHNSRCSIQVSSNSDGMDLRQEVLPIHSIKVPSPSSRLVCKPNECPTPSIRLFNARPIGSESECTYNRLEPMEVSIPISSCESFIKSSDKIKILPRVCSSHCPRMAKFPLVPTSNQSLQKVSSSKSNFISNCYRGDYLFLILSDQSPTRMDILKLALKEDWSPEVVEIISSDIRSSTVNQYQCIWSSFVKFLKGINPTLISADTLIKFFIHCFEVNKLAVSTIQSYKSALVPISKYAFKIQIDEKIYESMFRSFKLKRPNKVTHPSVDWELDKVLRFISSFQRPFSIHNIMSKCAFLLFMVTAGRCSEVASFSRLPEHVKYLNTGISLLPLPSFLAKNENPLIRFDARLIKPYFDNINLCPVNAIKDALSVPPSSSNDNSLILNPSSRKKISLLKLRTLVCSLIKNACPESFPKSHDIRKLASSTLLLGTGNLNQVIKHCHWHSSKSFVKHYLIDSLSSDQTALDLLASQTGEID